VLHDLSVSDMIIKVKGLLLKKYKYNNMSRTESLKPHLAVKRFKIMKFLLTEKYSIAEIASMFNIDRSVASRILSDGEKYKKSVKNLLKD
jgi:predicted DNA-binding protein YlxM (UPF0122 family)